MKAEGTEGKEGRLVEGETIWKIKGREYTLCIWNKIVIMEPSTMYNEYMAVIIK